jgi:hypothetical protein
MRVVELAFERFEFRPAYEVEVGPEFPGDGDWGCPVFGFDRNGELMETFDSRWGTPVVVRVEPRSGGAWVGTFAAGGLGGVTGAFACPSPASLLLVVDGLAHLVDVAAPEQGSRIVHDQVSQLTPVEGAGLLLLVRFIDIVALGPTGIAWTTPRLAVDDLRVEEATSTSLVCTCDNLGGTGRIELDPASGVQVAGTRLESVWPPDALA